MREIKFRFWLTEEKKIKMGYDEVKYISADNPKNCIDEVHINPFNYRIPEQAIIMQYTGLKDKNGIEIYEGDIVKYWDGSTESVTWNNCGFWSGWGTLGISEVIGNIYENPELLDENTAG